MFRDHSTIVSMSRKSIFFSLWAILAHSVSPGQGCGQHEVPNDSGAECERTCSNFENYGHYPCESLLHLKKYMERQPVGECICAKGYARQGEHCIPVSECPQCPKEDNLEYTSCLETIEGDCRNHATHQPGETCKKGCFCREGYRRSLKNESVCLTISQCHRELKSMGEKSPYDAETVEARCERNEEYRNGPDDTCEDVINKREDDATDGTDEYDCKCKKSFFRETNSATAPCVRLRDCPQVIENPSLLDDPELEEMDEGKMDKEDIQRTCYKSFVGDSEHVQQKLWHEQLNELQTRTGFTAYSQQFTGPWPGKKVYYELPEEYHHDHRIVPYRKDGNKHIWYNKYGETKATEDVPSINPAAILRESLDQLERFTCLKYIDVSNMSKEERPKTYIRITSKEASKCNSKVGRLDEVLAEKQTMNLALPNEKRKPLGCFAVKTVQHEFLHATGFQHVQARYDRNKYIDLHIDKIESRNSQHNFAMDPCGTEYYVKWDWWSGMLYGESEMMTKKARWKKFPQEDYKPSVSCCDLYAVQKAYECELSPPPGCEQHWDDCGITNGPPVKVTHRNSELKQFEGQVTEINGHQCKIECEGEDCHCKIVHGKNLHLKKYEGQDLLCDPDDKTRVGHVICHKTKEGEDCECVGRNSNLKKHEGSITTFQGKKGCKIICEGPEGYDCDCYGHNAQYKQYEGRRVDFGNGPCTVHCRGERGLDCDCE